MIVGAGQVGRHVAENLSSNRDIAVIDTDPDRVEHAQYELDVMGIHGDGTLIENLREAGVPDCEKVIASTDDDRTNIVVCGMAKILKDVFTIARINRTSFVDGWRQGKRALGVDFMVGSNYLTARTITQIVGLPSALEVDTFMDGRVHLTEFLLPEGSPLDNNSIEDINRQGGFEELNVMAVFSPDGDGLEFKVPRGDTLINQGDRVLVAGRMKKIHRFARMINPEAKEQNGGEIVILGGGEVGFQVARIMEGSGFNVRLIERNEDRARFLAEELPETLVLNEDADNPDFLLEEHVDEARTVVASLGEDESNLLACLLSKQLGTSRAVSVVNNRNYVDLFEQVGIDVAVNPRLITAEEITRYTHGEGTENVAILESEHVEVLEIELNQESPIANRLIQDVVDDLPREIVFGAITRDHEFLLPRGSVKLKPGDHVLILVGTDQATQLREQI